MAGAGAFDGKVAWITGGGEGIGRAIALALGARGARVLVTGRDERSLGETVGELAHGGAKARHLVGDVRDPESARAAVARAIDTWGALDLVVAAAGAPADVSPGAPDAPFGADLDRAEAILRTSLFGVLYTFYAAAAAMRGPGRLVVASRALGDGGGAGHAAARASEAGVEALVRAVAWEVAGRGITCNAIAPAALEPAVEPEEIAEIVLFLCGRAADAITGQTIALRGAPRPR